MVCCSWVITTKYASLEKLNMKHELQTKQKNKKTAKMFLINGFVVFLFF